MTYVINLVIMKIIIVIEVLNTWKLSKVHANVWKLTVTLITTCSYH